MNHKLILIVNCNGLKTVMQATDYLIHNMLCTIHQTR